MTSYLLVRSGRARYGVPLSEVVEVMDAAEVVVVPAAHPAVRGLSAVRGRLLPRVHLEGLVTGQARPAVAPPTLVVAGAGGRSVAFEVDEVDLAAQGQVLPLPAEWTGPSAIGVAQHDGDLIPVLDVQALLARL
ncbi:MAG: chemotaxis protein CheW [Gemmatimonadetes bacterium]|nr:chemotaxis protein CheW [Gemmatimonadota bacterium]MBI2536428.1 chemotaxis protein CheW [Gemmatimonadota bacterium]MBI2614970.1 chemotaxis protein CheW [Gemmatimonadota bacterium]MBI3081542.1 chemotaxis protein CheW [Gemmatimonadota bacterium]